MSKPAEAAAPAPQETPMECVCATCLRPVAYPRPSLNAIPFQCPHCRINGTDVKILYTKRSFPSEYSTR